MNKFAIFICLAFAFLFTNCQKEKICSEGYTGPDCRQEVTPLRISVDAIRVVRFPTRKSNGQQWDTFGSGHPDLYIKLYEERTNNKLVNIDYYMEDVTTSVTFNEPVTFDYPNENHVLELLDYDGILEPHVVATFSFKPHQVGTDFPSIIKLVTTNVEIELIGTKYNF